MLRKARMVMLAARRHVYWKAYEDELHSYRDDLSRCERDFRRAVRGIMETAALDQSHLERKQPASMDLSSCFGSRWHRSFSGLESGGDERPQTSPSKIERVGRWALSPLDADIRKSSPPRSGRKRHLVAFGRVPELSILRNRNAPLDRSALASARGSRISRKMIKHKTGYIRSPDHHHPKSTRRIC
jgi:hypothetical protein